MKKHNTLKVVLITILVLVLLTWILPAAYYSSGYVDQGRVQMGLFDLFSYPVTSLSYFGYLALFILVVGAFYGVLNKIGAYRTLLDRLVNKFKGKEKIVISAIMVLLAVLTSICGLQFGLVVFFPMIISLVLLMGYDKVVAALTVVGSTMIGMAGSTYAYSNTGLIMSVLGLKIDSELITKVVILVVGIILLIFNTFVYIKKNENKKQTTKKIVKEGKTTKTSKTTKTTKGTKTKNTTKSSTKAAVKDDEKIVVKSNDENTDFVPTAVKNKNHKIWPLVTVLVILFVILVLGFISWAGAFNSTLFTDITTSVTQFELFGFAIFGKILGTIKEFGSWTVADISIILVLATLLLSCIYKIKFDDMIDGIKDGAYKAIKPAVIVILLYTCLVIVTYHPFQLVIYKAILGLTDGFNALTSSLVAILTSLFNIDAAYAFNSSLPYLASLVDSSTYSIVGVIFQAFYGLTMLVAPTSVILMMVLSYLDISYCDWLKSIWKLLVELVVVLAIIIMILVLI